MKITMVGSFYCWIDNTQDYVRHPGHFLNYSLSLCHIPYSKMRPLGDWAAENLNSTSTSHYHSFSEIICWSLFFGSLKHNYEPNVTLCSSQLSSDEFQGPLKAEERCYMELHKSKSTKTCPCILQFIICF